MKIKVIGSGCESCKKMYLLAQQAVKELGLKAEVEYSTNVQEVVELGLLHTPVLLIDGTPVDFDRINIKDVKKAIESTACECGSDCDCAEGCKPDCDCGCDCKSGCDCSSQK